MNDIIKVKAAKKAKTAEKKAQFDEWNTNPNTKYEVSEYIHTRKCNHMQNDE